ncbi:class IIb bacteriocin, lactobin A/cerein 7B family [Streptococcus macacae]|uniref:Class IIb bacteriocin, lactobin A/cerein 7B family n=1 Tax=Streptococcus macacae NCTC 11558 TaxID=764298 RepID=G5JUW1_9STRE|nr:class IIb bacteriocin, lactobin A/cerein 7B family [Streptococcus macacae]EHJ52610.1 class IIb bacteriocin, lactobin A/cerein 7B family [Streptococcus macacae NCTC 11558]EHJ53065.1 class IIb bacteriocin, lactobin A/cerein 7B family [Streptococcus macacae NCTC 11558]SUN79259.1 class IIb bacteriocin, lactobin A/cerein 7B family [Streptococcus macacae NCTC 11558]SUN79261.1 class IIb bacteriocin, lactobin A/cerein 7B family [Streptococcus macacae NCTC 11558]
MTTSITNYAEMTDDELMDVNGGEVLAAIGTGIAAVTLVYGAGYAVGKAYYYYTH